MPSNPKVETAKKLLPFVLAGVAVLGLMNTVMHPNPSPRPDFGITINPMYGSVQQGEETTTQVRINGFDGYGDNVSLNANGQPSGTIINFNPLMKRAMPWFASTVTINVNSNVPAKNYTINITGNGAYNGIKHSCDYTLIVKPNQPQGEQPQIRILFPVNGTDIGQFQNVDGVAKRIPEGYQIWHVIYAHNPTNGFYPKVQINPDRSGVWSIKDVDIGNRNNNGYKFDIIVLLANESAQKEFRNYFYESNIAGGVWPSMGQLPVGTKEYDTVTVTRAQKPMTK